MQARRCCNCCSIFSIYVALGSRLLCFFDQRCAWCGTAYEAGAATTLQRHGEMTLREFAVRPFDTQVFKADRPLSLSPLTPSDP